MLRRVFRLERLMYASIGRALTRRPAVPPGAQGFRCHGPILAVLITLIIVSAVELVIVDIIVSRWVAVRIPLLVLGVWGLVWMIGLLCAHLMRPHTVGPDGIEVRDGMDLDVRIPWDVIDSVALRTQVHPEKAARVRQVDGTRSLVVAVSDRTNVEILLHQPTEVVLPGAAPKGGTHQVDVVLLWADDPAALLAAVAAVVADLEHDDQSADTR